MAWLQKTYAILQKAYALEGLDLTPDGLGQALECLASEGLGLAPGNLSHARQWEPKTRLWEAFVPFGANRT